MYHQRATIHCDNFEFIINGSLLQHVSFDSIQFGSSCATNATLREKWCIFSFWHQRNHESQSNLLPNFLCASGNDFRLLYDNDSVFNKLYPLHLMGSGQNLDTSARRKRVNHMPLDETTIHRSCNFAPS